ncbi:MAG: AAA family ATPase [Rhodospirillaceae bacterium]|nr:AAA family ATPase [Rhodospirillaceae bacterium]
MFLHRIKLKNILSMGPSGQDLALKPLNVLIGPNGSGKSNLIEVIGLLQAAPENLHKTIREGGGVTNWVWRGDPRGTFAEIEVLVSHESTSSIRYKLCFYEVDQRFRIHSESLCEVSTDRNPDPIPYFDAGTDKVFLLNEDSRDNKDGFAQKVVSSRPDQSVFTFVKAPEYRVLTFTGAQFQRIRLYREWAFGRRAPLRLPQPADLPNDELMEDGTNLGLVLNRLKRDHPKASDRLLEELHQLYDGIEAIDVSIEGGTVQLFLREGDKTVPATRLSDGTLRYICLLAVLCHPDPPPLVCLEEPELGLHPDLLPGLADLLREASERTQLIVTTHSDVLVDKLTDEPDSVVICEKLDGQTQLRRLDSDDLNHWLDRYSLGELWTKGELGGNRW